jgi:hypothetical protein
MVGFAKLQIVFIISSLSTCDEYTLPGESFSRLMIHVLVLNFAGCFLLVVFIHCRRRWRNHVSF